ncbi:MAG: hypothetical protein K0R51_398 [Cytophagaceae bacterium]|jgi:hypothetical protein|nr:hypothetical protein [Cytophagaceae bacterium]
MVLFNTFVSKTEEYLLRIFILRSYCRSHNFSLRHTFRAVLFNLFQ